MENYICTFCNFEQFLIFMNNDTTIKTKLELFKLQNCSFEY